MILTIYDRNGTAIFTTSADVAGRSTLIEDGKTTSWSAAISFADTSATNWLSVPIGTYYLGNGSKIEINSSRVPTFYYLGDDKKYHAAFGINTTAPFSGATFGAICLTPDYCYFYSNTADGTKIGTPTRFSTSVSLTNVETADPQSDYHYTRENWDKFWSGYNYQDPDQDFDITQDTTATDPVDFPELPSWDAVKTGLIHLYDMNLTDTKNLMSDLWSDSLLDQLKKMYNNPIDCIISANLLPFAIENTSGRTSVLVGKTTLPTAHGDSVSAQYQIIDCGTLNCGELFADFTDYSPYSSASIYLYGIGVKALDINEIMSSTLHLKYYVDLLSGNCVANLKITKDKPTPKLNSVLYSWTGNVGQSVMLSSSNYTQMVSQMINATIQAGTAAANSNPLGMLNAMVTAGTAATQGYSYEKTGSLGQSTSFLSPKACFLILTRPVQNNSEIVGAVGGENTIKRGVSSFSGFTVFKNAHADGISAATSYEVAEIENLLNTGVFI